MNSVAIRPYTLKELAGLYHVCRPTMRAWIKRFNDQVGKRVGHFYTIKQVELIFELIGRPDLED
jgi:hypothetical protein